MTEDLSVTERAELLNILFKGETPEIILAEPNGSAPTDQLFYLLPKVGGGVTTKQCSPRAMVLLRKLLEET
jgi:hypothetical protein